MPTTPGTPARRRREREEAYIAFNNNPKLVGTRTGIAMPTNVPRDSMGFEDGHAFFNSSPVAPDTDGRTTTYSRRTPGTGKTTRTSMAPNTGAAERHTTAQSNRRKRLSDMGEDGPDDTFAQGGADLLLDDDFGGDDANATPFFKSRSVTHVPLPPSSRRGGRTSSATGEYADLPSPSIGSPSTRKSIAAQRKSKGSISSRLSASVSPQTSRRTTAHSRLSAITAPDTTVEMDELGDALAIDESLVAVQMEVEGFAAEEEEENHRASARSKGKGKAKAKSDARQSTVQRQESEEEEEGEAEDLSEEEPRRSRLSTKSNRSYIGDTTIDLGDADRTRASIGVDMNDSFGDTGLEADNYGDVTLDDFPGEEAEEAEDANEDVDMEQDAMEEGGGAGLEEIQEEEEQEEEEEEEEEPAARPVKTAAKKVKTRPPPAKSAARSQREDSAAVREKKRKRLSNFPNELDGNGYQGDFQTRRSGRQHISPLEYWRGEKVSYGKGQHQAVIKEVVTIPRDPVVPLGKKARGYRGKSRGRSKSRHDSAPPIQEWDRETEQIGVVKDYITGEEEERRIVFPSHMLKTKLVQTISGDAFGYQKTFGDDFHASGYVEIGVGQSKPTKPSRDNAYTFCVLEGVANVCIHRTAFVVAQHGQFEVPRGNEYKITNINENGPLRLFFTQSRKVASSKEEDAALAAELAESASQASKAAASQRTTKGAGGRRSVSQTPVRNRT